MEVINAAIRKEKLPMKYSSLTTILLLIFTCLQPAQAYSPFFSMEGKDAAELAKLGITISLKKQVLGSIDGHDLVEIIYDTSKLKEDQEAYMVLQVIDGDGKFVSAFRTERKKGEAEKVAMQIVLDEKTMKYSHLMIGIPELLAEGAERVKKARIHGDPGFGGYIISSKRIMALARDAGEKKNVPSVPK